MALISIILGSDSDIHVFDGVSSILKDFKIVFEKRIISAHRTPDELRKYVKEAENKGIKIFIAIAGMAAALPGVIASYTTLPVIGVPVAQKSSVLGLDSLFSILQMPPGVPVATVAVNGGKNAGLLAVAILAISDKNLMKNLVDYRKKQKDIIIEKDRKFQDERGANVGKRYTT